MPFDREKMCVLSFFDDPTHIFRPWTPQAFYNLTKYFSCEPIVCKHNSTWKGRLAFPFLLVYALITRNALRLETYSWAATGWRCSLIAKKPMNIQGKPDFRYYIPER